MVIGDDVHLTFLHTNNDDSEDIINGDDGSPLNILLNGGRLIQYVKFELSVYYTHGFSGGYKGRWDSEAHTDYLNLHKVVCSELSGDHVLSQRITDLVTRQLSSHHNKLYDVIGHRFHQPKRDVIADATQIGLVDADDHHYSGSGDRIICYTFDTPFYILIKN
jgi:hypothetical protein